MPWNTSGDLYKLTEAPSLYDLEFDAQAQIAALEQEMARVAPIRAVGVAGRAILVGVHTGDRAAAEASLQELQELARTADVQVLDLVLQARREIDPRTLVGEGKLQEILVRSMALGADLLVFDRDLAPSQARHIAEAWVVAQRVGDQIGELGERLDSRVARADEDERQMRPP